MDIYSAAAHLYSAIPPELRAALSQKLAEWGVHAFEEAQGAAQEINEQEALYKWYLEEFVEHFSTIETLDQLVPFTGSLGVDRFLLWPELDEETRRSIDKPNGAERDRQPPLPRKLKATELLTHPLGNNRLFAVEGAAGVGKTTMARALARFAATQTLELMERENEDGSQVQYLPLYFNAEDLIKLAASTPVGQVSPSGEGALKDLLGGVLQKPNRALLVIVDGLDEVEGPIRTKALNVLRGLWLPGGNHRYLLLGRPGSISNVPWVREEKAVLKLTLKPWGEDEAREYLGFWTDAGGHPHLEIDELDQLVEYMRSRVGLPSPALLVQMVVASYVELKRDGLENPLERMPATRTELYRHYLRLLLERSEGDKAVRGAGSTAHPADLEQRKWLGCLELLLRLSPKQRERARAQKCSANHLPDAASARVRGRSCGKLLREEADFTKWWEDRKLCRLGHESLHEFLAAEALARLYQGDPQRFWKDWLHPSIFDPYWQQTLIFVMALMDEEDQSALMRGLLDLGSCDPISELTGRHLEVMAKAWGAGVQYDPAVWHGWLDSHPEPDLLVAVAANANLSVPALEALKQLARELENKEMRLRAAEALGKLNPEMAVFALDQLAKEGGNEWVRFDAAQALLELKPEVPAYITGWLSGEVDEALRFSLAVELVKFSPELAMVALEKLARGGESGWIRLDALELLMSFDPELAMATLEELVKAEGNKRLKLEYARYVSKYKPELAIAVLEGLALEGGDIEIEFDAAISLLDLKPALAEPFLKRLVLKTKNKWMKVLVIEKLEKLGPALAPVLEQMAGEDKDELVQLYAISSLKKLMPASLPELSRLAKNAGDERAQLYAAEALLELDREGAIAIIEELAKDGENDESRLDAAKILMGLKPKLASVVLEELARESRDAATRILAAEALLELDREGAIAIIEELAKDGENDESRLDALEYLKKLGPEAVPALVRVANEADDEWGRLSAARGLAGLKPELAVLVFANLIREVGDEWVRREVTISLGRLGVPPMGCAELSQEPN